MPSPTVIRVKYVGKNTEGEEPGADSSSLNVNEIAKEVMVNIDCPMGLIIDYVRSVACLEGEIDLCEETSSRMENLNDVPGWTRGTDILVPGTVYFVVKVERDKDARISRVFPSVVARASKIAAEIMSRIKAPARQRSTSVTRKISHDKIAGKNIHQEKRTRASKPASKASRVTEGQGK